LCADWHLHCCASGRAGWLLVELGILLSSLLLGVTIRLGYLFYQGKKHNGTFSLHGIVLYWGHMPWWHYLLIFVPFLVYALGLELVLQPVSKTLIAQHENS
jgi:hypothetical protein